GWYPFDDATNSWGISVAHTIFPIVCTPTGVHEILTPSGNMAVAPNPSSTGVFTIVIPHHDLKETVAMNVYDSKGTLIFSSNQKAGNDFTYSLNLSNFAKGIYLLKAETSEGVNIQKITIN
ncbi:MAG: T9SS type A sorting domain-containing protein, partial [Bacteroidota bacterium]